jgi:RecB family exonuclease
VITPRTTRLTQVANLREFRGQLLELALGGDLSAARSRAVIVPTQTAAEQLRRLLEDRAIAPGRRAIVLPHLVTRDQWQSLLREDLPGGHLCLSSHEREVMLGAAAREAMAGEATPPFTVRPGIVAEMLAFYDALRRHLRTVADFERLVGERFEREIETDRGAVRLLAQTRFMAAAFRGYEARLAAAGALDEHRVRERLIEQPVTRFSHVVVAVADRAGDAHGLWLSDFDLLARAGGVVRIDIIATASTLKAGWLDRLRDLLPGIEEAAGPDVPAGAPPCVAAPAGADAPLHFVHRDREEELRAVARRIKRRARAMSSAGLGRTGIVFKRPLPYVYLAGQVLPSAGVPHEAFDALPLAAEPYAAALDLIFGCLDTGFARTDLVALLKSPVFTFDADGRRLTPTEIAAFDRALSEARYPGDAAQLRRLIAAWSESGAVPGGSGRSRRRASPLPAALTCVRMIEQLDPLTRVERPSAHLETLIAFLVDHDELARHPDPTRERILRARAAIHASIGSLRDAHSRHDDHPRAFAETAATIRRWIGQQTFAPHRGRAGVQLLDPEAARFGDFETLYLVGLIEREWPGSERRSIFYPASLLAQLGWPPEPDARAADRASFSDLMQAPSIEVVVSTFTLEDDAIVEPSPFLEDLSESGLTVSRDDAPARVRIFEDEAWSLDPIRADVGCAPASDWLSMRRGRTPAALPQFHGQSASPGLDAYKVSSLDQYLSCPFIFFASEVLGLEEDPGDEQSPGPRWQGQLIHEVLQRFYEAWQQEGEGAITSDNLDRARGRFAQVAEHCLSRLSDSDAALQRARLLGSAVAPGIGDIVCRIEAEHPATIVERLMEFSLNGETRLRSADVDRAVRLRATADRIDLLADGTFRVVDYKLSRAPALQQVVQLPAYAASARQRLEGHRGRGWRPAGAAYITFGKTPYVPLVKKAGELDAALAEGEARLLKVVDRIERGEFPPSPRLRRTCVHCPYSPVCRKDYVGDE